MIRIISIAVLFIVTSACASSRGDFLLNVGAYQSPNFENMFGTSQFHVDGTSHLANPTISISLVIGVPTLISLDYSEGEGSMSPPSNSDPTTMFSGTATSTVTLNGVIESVDDAYLFTAPPKITFPFTTPTFSGGPSVVFDLGAFTATITPVASVGAREATFLLAAVPEPSSLLLCGIAGVIGLTFARVSRKRYA